MSGSAPAEGRRGVPEPRLLLGQMDEEVGLGEVPVVTNVGRRDHVALQPHVRGRPVRDVHDGDETDVVDVRKDERAARLLHVVDLRLGEATVEANDQAQEGDRPFLVLHGSLLKMFLMSEPTFGFDTAF